VKVRAALAPRRESYWAPPLGTNQSLGFRKIDHERGSWIARRKENGRPRYRALGAAKDRVGFIEARAAAHKWFQDGDRGITGDKG